MAITSAQRTKARKLQNILLRLLEKKKFPEQFLYEHELPSVKALTDMIYPELDGRIRDAIKELIK